MKKALKTISKTIITIAAIAMLFVVACNVWVVYSTKDRVFYALDELPMNNVALLLGTSKYSRSGKTNMFFKYRIEAAAELYKKNKIRHIIASGDNSYSYYNEPQDMKKALLSQSIPAEGITLDYAGFRTFDSVVRSKKIFNQDTLTIITQEFHCYRALFISDYYKIHAVAYATQGVPKGSFTIVMREYLARCKAVIDLYVLGKKPRFLGDTIKIDY